MILTIPKTQNRQKLTYGDLEIRWRYENYQDNASHHTNFYFHTISLKAGTGKYYLWNAWKSWISFTAKFKL